MSETPDFEWMGRDLLRSCNGRTPTAHDIANHLRLIWNARGAADSRTLDAALTASTGLIESHETLDRLIRQLDR